jgi:LmbE family N-acetylglucosaminyl deacetylase
MKPGQKSSSERKRPGSERRAPARPDPMEASLSEPGRCPALQPLLAFGAHPDDIEFGCGGVIAKETRAGRKAHFIVCSRGEAGTHGTAAQRVAEAKKSAALLGATVEFIELDGDAHLEVRVAHAIKLAGILRRVRPGIVLAPSLVGNQHPDHAKLGRLVCDAARLARYGGLKELRRVRPHAIAQLFFYAVTPEAEPSGITPLLIDVSAPEIMAVWTAAMAAHVSQVSARSYVELQLTRARLRGLRAGIGHAIALFSNDPPVLDSLAQINRSARRF